jgi:Fe-S-cluster containining protein
MNLKTIPPAVKAKMEKMAAVYDAFAGLTAPCREAAACGPGCAFCCKGPGAIDITTLEGLVILERLGRMPRKGRQRIEKAIAKDRRLREGQAYGNCPFLQKNDRCCIYDQRPFACRRLYSLETCSGNQPPVLHRQVMESAEETLAQLQRLDDTGYSGHLSYILYMLETPAFLDTYLSGGFEPERVAAYGRSHRIVINRSVA